MSAQSGAAQVGVGLASRMLYKQVAGERVQQEAGV